MRPIFKQTRSPDHPNVSVATGGESLITRRRVLAAGATGLASAMLAACGEEESALSGAVELSAEVVRAVLADGIDAAMNRYN